MVKFRSLFANFVWFDDILHVIFLIQLNLVGKFGRITKILILMNFQECREKRIHATGSHHGAGVERKEALTTISRSHGVGKKEKEEDNSSSQTSM